MGSTAIQPPTPNSQTPRHPTPSLREQREAKRRLAARHDEDDLFGEDEWDDEPTTNDEDDKRQSMRTSTPDELETEQPIGRSQRLDAPVPRPPSPSPQPSSTRAAMCWRSWSNRWTMTRRRCWALRTTLRSEEGGETPRRTIRPGFEPSMDAIVRGHPRCQALDRGSSSRRSARGWALKTIRACASITTRFSATTSRFRNSYADRVPADYIRKQTLVDWRALHHRRAEGV